MNELEKKFNERVGRFIATTNLTEPDKVPVLGLYQTWVYGYSKTKIKDIIDDFEKEFSAYAKVMTDFEFDGVFATGSQRAINFYDALGSDSFFVSEDGYTLQHQETVMMPDPEDYPKLINDPLEFTFNKLFPERYPNLRGEEDAIKGSLKKSIASLNEFVGNMIKSGEIAKEQFGLPSVNGGMGISAVDILFDFYRGFKGISLDIRRRPEMVLETADRFADILIDTFASNVHCKGGFPFIFVPIHLPGFLSPKQFETIYWPSFKKIFFPLMEQGFKFEFYMETAASHLYEFINEFPKGKSIILLEKDDLKSAKEKIGSNVTIAGGLSTRLLKYGTKQECIDQTKMVIDSCAPGGGFILTTDNILIAPDDVNPENFKAALNCAHEYGIY
ncbi:MAG: uroporphyrinogen decarboxylase family protein [Anaerofustis sp.]